MTAPRIPFARGVFVNCPFDPEFVPLLHALLFAIHDCGFASRIAIEATPGTEPRLEKINRLIVSSRFSIHDLSRLPTRTDQLPRFNMPFECGMAYGVMKNARARDGSRAMLFMTAVPYQDHQTTSDLGAFDGVAHNNEPREVIAAVRHFLHRHTDEPMRGEQAIFDRFGAFEVALPRMAEAAELTLAEVTSFPYVNEWVVLMSEWIGQNPTRLQRV